MAQNDSVKETIDGVTYTMYMMEPLASALLLRRIGEVVSPALAAFATNPSIANMDISSTSFVEITQGLFKRLDDQLLRDVISALSLVTIVEENGQISKMPNVFDQHFRGRIGQMIAWIAFGLRVQYRDFLSKAKTLIAPNAPLIPAGVPSSLPAN